jgi:LEA14-like dessication related protein
MPTTFMSTSNGREISVPEWIMTAVFRTDMCNGIFTVRWDLQNKIYVKLANMEIALEA